MVFNDWPGIVAFIQIGRRPSCGLGSFARDTQGTIDQLGLTFNVLQTHSPVGAPEYFSNFRFDVCVHHNDVEVRCKEFASWMSNFEPGSVTFDLPNAIELTAESALTLTFTGEHWVTCPAEPSSSTGSVQMTFNPVELVY